MPFSKGIVYINSLFHRRNKMVFIWQNHLLSEETEFSGNVFFSQNCKNYLPYYIHLEQESCISSKPNQSSPPAQELQSSLGRHCVLGTSLHSSHNLKIVFQYFWPDHNLTSDKIITPLQHLPYSEGCILKERFPYFYTYK